MLTAQCIILGVEIRICALYGLSLASTFVPMPVLSGSAGEDEAEFGYFVPTDVGGGQEQCILLW